MIVILLRPHGTKEWQGPGRRSYTAEVLWEWMPFQREESWFHNVFTDLTVNVPKDKCFCSSSKWGSSCECVHIYFPWICLLVYQYVNGIILWVPTPFSCRIKQCLIYKKWVNYIKEEGLLWLILYWLLNSLWNIYLKIIQMYMPSGCWYSILCKKIFVCFLIPLCL